MTKNSSGRGDMLRRVGLIEEGYEVRVIDRGRLNGRGGGCSCDAYTRDPLRAEVSMKTKRHFGGRSEGILDSAYEHTDQKREVDV